jgi:pimeloyl-ACP methyl ester carboxylesterase
MFKSLEVRADVFLSFFDPNSLANMSQSASSFKQSVPFLWIIGRQDRLYPEGSAYAFDRAPTHPKSKHLIIDAGHMNTSLKAAQEVLEWIR